MELKGVVGPADLLPGRGGANVSVGMATRRLGWPAVVAIGAGWLTEGGVTKEPPKHEETRWRQEKKSKSRQTPSPCASLLREGKSY